MGDLSEFFKKGFQNLKKQAIERNYQQRTLKDRMEEFNEARRQTRGSLMFQKRNIDEKNLTPYNTPESEKTVNKLNKINETKQQVPNKRLEMLQKWKAEREKKKEEAKKKSKPLFKVCHIPISVGLPNLETVNKEIKGKSINISKFAPENHIFKPPVNIKPINYTNESKKPNNTTLDSNRNSKKNIKMLVKPHSLNNFQLSKCSGNIKINDKSETRNFKGSKLNTIKEVSRLHSGEQFETNSKKMDFENQGNKVNDKIATKSRSNRLNNTKEEVNRLRAHSNSKAFEKGSRKREYENQDNQKLVEHKEKSQKSNGTSRKTPNSNQKQSSTSVKQEGKKVNKNESVVKVIDHKEITNIRMSKSYVDSTSKHGKQKIVEILNSNHKTPNTPNKRNNRKVLPNEASIVSDTKQNSDILYSDDEITLRTPRKTPMKTPRKTPMKTPRKTPLKASRKTPLKEKTPENTKLPNISISNTDIEPLTSAVYISPFVTVSRGKESARKEYKIRQSTGGSLPDTPDFGKFLSKATSPSVGADYFSNKLDNEINRIQLLCDDWLQYKEADIPEDVIDLIDVAVGQSKLLMAKKFSQFRHLISECREYANKERPVTCMDLHGFWDTMYMQVEDINKRFNNLEVLKGNNWQTFIPENKSKTKNIKSRPVRQTKSKASSKIKDMIKLARARKDKEVKNDGGGFEFEKSEVSSQVSQTVGVTKRRSSRLSTLQSEHMRVRLSSSPGLTMMKITQAIKLGDGITPNSILKTNSRKSEKRMTKCVLFKDLEEAKDKPDLFESESNKENNLNNSQCLRFDVRCSPVEPMRRSRRLSKNVI